MLDAHSDTSREKKDEASEEKESSVHRCCGQPMKKIPGFVGAYTCEVCTNTYVAEEGERKEFKRLFGDA